MKVIKMTINSKQCMGTDNFYVILFKTEEAAIKYLNDNHSGYIEITDDIKKQIYWTDDIPRTFKHEKPQFDADGGYDYPIEYEIEFEAEDVLE